MGAKKLTTILILLCLFLCVAYATNSQEDTKLYLVFFTEDGSKELVENYGEITYEFTIVNAVSAKLTEEAAAQLIQEAGIERVEENEVIELDSSTSSPKEDNTLRQTSEQIYTTNYTTGSQWNLTSTGINAENAWANHLVDGTGVKIAIIDTGVNYLNPDLDNGYLGGYDFCSNGEGRDCSGEDSEPLDNQGHGTGMASAILAEGTTVSGVAPNAGYYAIKISDDITTTSEILLKAYEWALTETEAEIIFTGYYTTTNFICWRI